ncbi:MAG: serine hydrolase domain-containing protein, partial [Thermoanaerobaculia bacterium]|nr:serine hydrolase domain-containing protein [Thermoanaerobaculia bacterium]
MPVRARLLFVLCLLLVSSSFAQVTVDGHWEGEIRTPGPALRIDVDLETDASGVLTGDISIPAQGARDLPLADISRDGSSIRFAIPGIPGEPTFSGTLSEDGTRIAGTFSQGGQELEFELERAEDPVARARGALEGFGAAIEQALADFNAPGAALAVVAGGETVWAEGFGHRDLEAEKPMTPDTLFAIGSTTKAMTSTLLGMLVDEGKLAWDEPLREVLPTFELADPMISARVTPRDLVTHRTGLPRHDLLWYNNNEGTREEL